MNIGVLLIAGVLLVCVTVVFQAWRQQTRQAFIQNDHLPPDLRNSTLWASEKAMHCRHPMHLLGRIDQVYRWNDGTLVITDTKRRGRRMVYESDRLQLSLYRILIEHRPWAWLSRSPVADYGYIRLVMPDGAYYHKVNLLSREKTMAIYQRYIDVLGGHVEPSCAKNKGLCQRCAYASDCPYMTKEPVASPCH